MASKRHLLSRAAVELRQVIIERKLSLGDIQRTIGSPQGLLSRWVRGLRKPGLHYAALLEKHYGIAVTGWGEKSGVWIRVSTRKQRRGVTCAPTGKSTGTDG